MSVSSYFVMTSKAPKPKSPFASAAYHLPPAQKPKGSPFKLIAACLVIGGVVFFIASPGNLQSSPLSQLKKIFTGSGGYDASEVFVPQVDLNQEEAAALYREGVANLQNGEFQKALDQFKKLEPAYPILTDMLWLREAECYSGLGNEWAVQKKLRSIIDDLGNSPMKTLAQYRIGQSQFRGREWDKAKDTFETIRKKSSTSPYAAGSLYYLAAIMARKPETHSKAIHYLQSYLSKYSDGKFGLEAASLLERLQTQPNATDHAWMGLAFAASSNDAQKALAHLKLGPIQQTWHAMGHLLIRGGDVHTGSNVLLAGLPYAKDAEDFSQGLDALLAVTPLNEKTALLKTIAAKHYTVGGDYALWKLAETDEPSSHQAYQQIVSLYPKGDYAPESMWHLMWPLISQNHLSDYIAQAQQFMDQYSYARSAPKVLFWIGKAQEKIDLTTAAQTYTKLRDTYPNTYYTFRAESRLQVINNGQSDKGWKINKPDSSGYVSQNTNLNTLDIFPEASRFGDGSAGERSRKEAQTLEFIGVQEDTRLFSTEAIGSLPAAVESWAAQINGDRARGIRTIRTALEKRVRQNIESNGQTILSEAESSTPDEMRLLYPIYFSQWIEPAAEKTGLDPYLVQALMREESYFNEVAVSGSNARGLMQLLPATAADVAKWEHLPEFKTADLFTPQVNIRLGSRYLSYIRNLFDGNMMPTVGAYNGGPGAMRRWVNASGSHFTTDPDMFVENIPYGQSRDYIKKVFGAYWNYQKLYGH
jgi:soluble lytic murein transglycosylase